MAKTDWNMSETVLPDDMNQIGQEINQLREDVDNIEIPPASTSQAGIVQLSSVVNSTNETMAATPKAVKQAYDHAEQAFQLGNERKQDLVDALIAIGVSASTSETWDLLLSKVAAIIRANGNADASEVLSGKTFSNASANGLTGSMPNRGGANASLTSQGQQYSIPNGYHNGTGKVTANITNLSAGNVRHGATVGGVAGSFSQFANGASAAQILTGRSAAVNGAAVNGAMPNRGNVNPTITTQGGEYTIPEGYHAGGGKVLANFANLVAGNVRNGVNIGGVVGDLMARAGAIGTTTVGSQLPFTVNTGATVNLNAVTVTGLTFKPSFILFIDLLDTTIYSIEPLVWGSQPIGIYNDSGVSLAVKMENSAYVNGTGFRLPTYAAQGRTITYWCFL